MAETDAHPAPSAQARRLIEAHGNANYACGAHPVTVGDHTAYALLAQIAREANAALYAHVAGLEAEVARYRSLMERNDGQ